MSQVIDHRGTSGRGLVEDTREGAIGAGEDRDGACPDRDIDGACRECDPWRQHGIRRRMKEHHDQSEAAEGREQSQRTSLEAHAEGLDVDLPGGDEQDHEEGREGHRARECRTQRDHVGVYVAPEIRRQLQNEPDATGCREDESDSKHLPAESRTVVSALERAGDLRRTAESRYCLAKGIGSIANVGEVALQLAPPRLAFAPLRDPRLAHDTIDERTQILAVSHGPHRGSRAWRRRSIPTACAWSPPGDALWQ